MANNISSLTGPNLYDIETMHRSSHAAKPKQTAHTELPKDNVSIGAHKDDAAPVDKKKWTVLVYSAADNNLETALVSDVAEMESVGGTENMNLIAQLDRGKNPSSLSGGWAGCKRFELLKGNHHGNSIGGSALEDLGQVNMSDPKTLTDFITWGMKKYPAENYMLLVSDHGGGWLGVAEDDSHHGWMTMPNFKKALVDAQKATGEKIDVLGFDACLMASTEVTDELKDVADYMVASENTIGGDGWNYSSIFSSKAVKSLQDTLGSRFTIGPREVAAKIVDDSRDHQATNTLSAIDLTKADALTKATDELAKKILDSSFTKSDLKTLARSSKNYYGFTDQYDFTQKLMQDPKADKGLKEAAQKVLDAISDAVIAEHHTNSMKGSHGLTIETAGNQLGGNVSSPKYQELQFAQNTNWDEAMNKKA